MVKDVENPKRCLSSDSKNGHNLVITSKSSKKTKTLGANVVCLANLASHVTTRDLIKKVMIYLQAANYIMAT